jgi:Uma2 family endonuclease
MGVPNLEPAISVEDYLTGEPLSEVRHEYIDGEVYAMAGGTANHNTIAGNFFAALHAHLRGKPCRVFMADMKARLLVDGLDIFYYPDIMVACDKRDTDPLFMRWPKVIIEVISQSTERVDRNEKLERYLTIPTLEEYVLVEQKRHTVTIYRRSQGWRQEVLTTLDAVVNLESIGLTLPVAQLYENVVLGEG